MTQHETDDLPDFDMIRDMTPIAAIQQSLFDLYREAREWNDRADPNDVYAWIAARIANLEQAQRDLAELRAIKAALATLKSSVL